MTTSAAGDGPDLVSDCGSCFGLCCVALPFARSVDFPTDKAAGDPCRNLLADSSCTIHDRLRGSGYRGCTVFECFGAGQQVSQVTFGGRDWRDHPDSARQMYAVFPVMRQLHEMRVHLTEAGALTALTDGATDRSLGVEVASLAAEVTGLVEAEADRLEHLDVVGLRARVGALLERASRLVRSGAELGHDLGRRRIGRGSDLVGADLRGLDLRGAYLIAADLRGADLRRVDLLGADLRDADLRWTGLSQALFVTQPQLNAARGDGRTSIAGTLSRPGWWPRTSAGPVPVADHD